MDKLKLIEHNFKELSEINYSIHSFISPTRHPTLIVTFKGEHGSGSEGNNDSLFMALIIRSALTAWYSEGIILDLKNLKYTSGDTFEEVIFASNSLYPHRHYPGPSNFPTALIVSDLNRTGITSLIENELSENPTDWLYDSLDNAVEAIERKIELKKSK